MEICKNETWEQIKTGSKSQRDICKTVSTLCMHAHLPVETHSKTGPILSAMFGSSSQASNYGWSCKESLTSCQGMISWNHEQWPVNLPAGNWAHRLLELSGKTDAKMPQSWNTIWIHIMLRWPFWVALKNYSLETVVHHGIKISNNIQ